MNNKDDKKMNESYNITEALKKFRADHPEVIEELTQTIIKEIKTDLERVKNE